MTEKDKIADAGTASASSACSAPSSAAELKPGSEDARRAGCICPILDNARGNGWMNIPGVFVMREDCPLHGFKVPNQKLSGVEPAPGAGTTST